MPTLDEQFQEWMLHGTLTDKSNNTGPFCNSDMRDAFLAGAAAEREAVLALLRQIRQQYQGGFIGDALDDIFWFRFVFDSIFSIQKS